MNTIAPSPVGERHVSSLMRRECITLGPGESLLEADRLMRLTRIRHLPVVRGGILLGILSHRDVIESGRNSPGSRDQALRSTTIESVMRTAPETVHTGCSLARAAERMLILRIGCLPVVEATDAGPRLIGLVTESDLLRAAYAPQLGPDEI